MSVHCGATSIYFGRNVSCCVCVHSLLWSVFYYIIIHAIQFCLFVFTTHDFDVSFRTQCHFSCVHKRTSDSFLVSVCSIQTHIMYTAKTMIKYSFHCLYSLCRRERSRRLSFLFFLVHAALPHWVYRMPIFPFHLFSQCCTCGNHKRVSFSRTQFMFILKVINCENASFAL